MGLESYLRDINIDMGFLSEIQLNQNEKFWKKTKRKKN